MKIYIQNHSKQGWMVCLLFAFLVFCTGLTHADDVSLINQLEALEHYQKEVRSLIVEAEAQLSGDATQSMVVEFLKVSADNVDFLIEILKAPADQRHELSRKLADSLQLRTKKQDELLDEDLSRNTFVVSENKLREELSQSTVTFSNLYIESLLIQKTLLQLKYFEDDDPKSGNFLEGFMNSNIPILRYSGKSKNKDNWNRHHGVSNWEMTFRAEPIVLFNHEKDPAVLLASGLLYNIFPSVEASAENPFVAAVDHNLFSKYIKRLGPRVGLGARIGEGTDFIFGGGMQVASLTVWSVYDSSESEFTWAVGISDWKWVNNVLPIFGQN